MLLLQHSLWHSEHIPLPISIRPISKNATVYQLRPQKFHTFMSFNKNKIPTIASTTPPSLEHFPHIHIISPREVYSLGVYKVFGGIVIIYLSEADILLSLSLIASYQDLSKPIFLQKSSV